MKIVVMGVSGSGKSTIGQLLADHFNATFFDGDDFHSQQNIKKMAMGTPLNDKDRFPWLQTLNQVLQDTSTVVLACSALKPTYRHQLSDNNPELLFIYLNADFELISERVRQRDEHFFDGLAMIKSQFDTLVIPSEDEAIVVDASLTPEAIIEHIQTALTNTSLPTRTN